MKKTIFPLLFFSAIAFSQTKPSPEIDKVKISYKTIAGFYVTAGGGESWESDVISNRSDETVSPTLGPITYERVSVKSVKGAGAIEAGLGYNFGNNLRAELSYAYLAKSPHKETTTGTVFHSGGSLDFSGETKISGQINKNLFLGLLYYNIPTKSRWVPFIGVGLGWARLTTTDLLYNYEVVYSNGNQVVGSRTEPAGMGNAPAFKTKLGINYLVSKKIAVFVASNYLHINRIDIGGGTIYEKFNVFGAKVGLIYQFSKNAQ